MEYALILTVLVNIPCKPLRLKSKKVNNNNYNCILACTRS